ncbi:riboflavin synthase subunit alpha [Rheinheimera sp. SA_1]|uniref:riboflavin synthase n=1 Tax=Rheinheimera sp. SA_1 TaxID=1827365 RepID=UPI00080122BF|nr:riboflavin synthase [Rheinheimera sp. SA_1]OBP14706.1 riboflavin synthase subunit alpha [Rheinheimera sp. SA_1]
MFTGIIEATGVLVQLSPHATDLSLRIQSDTLDFSDVKLGDSIASNGVCLTVTALGNDWFQADLSNETLARTLFGHYKTGQLINLEKALLPTTRLGGHLVSGHVDGVATVSRVEKSGRAWQIYLKMPADLSKYIAEKGSITIDGVSLTVNELTGDEFRLTIVPHTAQHTTLQMLQAGRQVHLEVDLLARYLERLLTGHQTPAKQGVSLELLQQRGFL